MSFIDTVTQSDRRRQAYALATQIGLSRSERHELAEIILKRDCESWKHLSEDDLSDLVTAMHGFAYIHYMINLRG